MIFGCAGTEAFSLDPAEYRRRWGVPSETPLLESNAGPTLRVGTVPAGPVVLDRAAGRHVDPESGVAVAVFGDLRLGDGGGGTPARSLLSLYLDAGNEAFARANGSFVVALADPRSGRVMVVRDQLGVEGLFYAWDGRGTLHFSNHLQSLKAAAVPDASLDSGSVIRYLLFNYNPGFESLFTGIRKLRPGHVLSMGDGGLTEEAYWRVSFREPVERPTEEYESTLHDLIRDSVRIRLENGDETAGAYLSGGTDSSSVVSLMSQELGRPIHTFSFRCSGETWDESRYARAVSEHWGSRHHEIPYGPDDALLLTDLVGRVSEPLSDVGIEIASLLLARNAGRQVDYVLTGDGGDELFAGHPVYLADRVATWYGWVPRPLRQPIGRALQLLPDGPRKKSLTIKLKRFAYSFEFPEELESNRWRMYYHPYELERLLTPEWGDRLNGLDPLEPLRQVYREADGPDRLSRSIYGDYHSVVDFYLRRMEVVRTLGFTARFPLLDPRLVQYVARIPSSRKMTGDSANKALFHGAMKDVLPRVILERKDKLGNSVPLKNWLRDSPALRDFAQEYLSEESLGRRGLFRPAYVRRLWERHQSRRENHSHRLWSLLTFELWCRLHVDGERSPGP